jgi:hypothetical protein
MKGIERGDWSKIGQIRSQFCHYDLSDLLAFFNSLGEIKNMNSYYFQVGGQVKKKTPAITMARPPAPTVIA